MCVCVIKTKFSPAAFCQPENAANALHCATHPTDVSCSLTWPRVRIVLLLRLHCQRPTVYAAWFILLSGLTLYIRWWPPQFAFIHKELLAQTFIIQKFPPLQSFWDTARIACGKNVDADSDTCLLLRMWSECSDSQASTSLCLAFDIAIVCLCSQHCEDANFPRSRTRRKCPCNWSPYKDSNASWGEQLGP